MLTWASPLRLAKDLKDRTADVLLESSEEAWLRSDTSVQPDHSKWPGTGFGPEGDTGRQPLAVSVVGRFKSHFADKASPLFGDAAEAENADGESGDGPDRTGRTTKESSPDARLAVVGSSAFAADLVTSLGQQIGGGVYRGNHQFLRNLVDWALQDTDLLRIRSSGAFARTLRPLKPDERTTWELANYGIVLAELVLIILLASIRRRRTRPITLQKGASA